MSDTDKAREIAQTLSGLPDPGGFEGRDIIAEALTEARQAGARDMRERAAKVAEAAFRSIHASTGSDSPMTISIAIPQRTIPEAIRSLPIEGSDADG